MVVGVLLGLVAAGLVGFVVVQAAASARAPETPRQPVVVALRDIPPNVIVDATMVSVKDFPVNLIPAGAATTNEDVVGKYATTTIFLGQPILTAAMLADTQGNEGVAYSLRPGQVLTTINFAGAAALINSGAVWEGDAIDVFVTIPGTSSTQIAYTMRNLKILYSGTAAGAPGRRRATSTQLFFAMSPQEASILKYMETLNPSFNLRKAGVEDIVPAQIVDMNFIISTYGLQRPTAPR
jgi:Flp pilus assembly protein CpaB